MVDNLSNGRVGISFASGWNPDDFIFFPERYATRDEHLFQSMQAVRTLWRGQPFEGTNGGGQPCSVTIFPRPVQPELPVWMTVAGNPEELRPGRRLRRQSADPPARPGRRRARIADCPLSKRAGRGRLRSGER